MSLQSVVLRGELLAIILPTLGVSTAAFAQVNTMSPAADPVTTVRSVGELDEVVVTAQRRNERLQDVPIAVEAFTSAQLDAAGIGSTQDLPMLTPGLVFGQQAGFAQPFLRGIGTVASGPGIENPVAVYVDGVYYSTESNAIMSLSNIEQIEVDKGPQGTLFGRNATGGLIQITTKDPSQEFGGSISATYGNYSTAGTDFYVTGGVTSNLAADLSGHYSNQNDGYGKNLLTGQVLAKTEDMSFRNKWVLKVDESTVLKLIFDYDVSHFYPNYGPAPGTTPLGAAPYPVPPQDTSGLFSVYGDVHQGGTSFHVQHDFDFAQFVSITSFRRTEIEVQPSALLSNDPAYAVGVNDSEKHTEYTQEFQLASLAGSRVKWTTGAYLYDNDSGYTPQALIYGGYVGLPYISLFQHQKDYSAALYGQATTEVAADTNLTVGVRYTVDRRNFEGTEVLGFPGGGSEAFTDKEHKIFDKPTWRFALDHHFTPDVMAYVSYNRGFKSGGFNDSLIPTVPYSPEVLDAFEIGAKTSLFDNHLSLNAAAFLYKYKGIQEIQYLAGTFFVYNGAAAKLYGLDLDAKWKATQYLSFTAALEVMHSDFTSFPDAPISTPMPGGGTSYTIGSVSGNTLPLTPDSSLSVTAEYVIPLNSYGNVTLSATDAYSNGWYGEPDNRLHQPAYNVVNAQAGWATADGAWKVQFWGRNLTNAAYTTALGSQPNGDFGVYAPPRTYGLTVTRKF